MAKHTAELKIEGMMCEHCKAHVTKALEALEGAEVRVDLEGGKAEVRSEMEIDDGTFEAAVKDAGYELKEIKRS